MKSQDEYNKLDSKQLIWSHLDMTETNHPYYLQTAGCEILPAMLPDEQDGTSFLWPNGNPDIIIAAAAACQRQAGVIQEKVDGCWCAMMVDPYGRLTNPLSRANLPLRLAADWAGQPVGERFAGWTLIGELEAGTTSARKRREARENKGYYGLPPFHIFAMAMPDGTTFDKPSWVAEVLCQMASIEIHGRLRAVPAAVGLESWGDFTRRILDAGGEGIIIRQLGHIWRAKTVITLDRYVLGVVSEKDRAGKTRHKARIGICTSAGERPRYRELQLVELPSGVRPKDAKHRVVAVTGASVNGNNGVIRHARIVEVRDQDEKQGTECRI